MDFEWLDQRGLFTNVAAALLATVLVGIILKVPQRIWRGFRERPRSLLRRHYRQAAHQVGFDIQVLPHVLAILDTKGYFDDLVMKANVPRHEELAQFRELISQRAPELPAHQIAKNYYDCVFDVLFKSRYALCRDIALQWQRELDQQADEEKLASPPDAGISVVRNIPGFFPIVLSDDKAFADGVCHDAEIFFSRLRTPIGPIGFSPLVQIGPANDDDWHFLLEMAVENFTQFKKTNREVHLVCAAPWLWCYALGTKLQDHYDVVLYHYQEHTYHRIWQLSREIKDLKSPRHGKQYEYQICGSPMQPAGPAPGTRNDALILAFNIGSHLDCVVDYREQNLPDVPVWVIRLNKDTLSPARPREWVNAAADLAYAIDALAEGRGDKHVYLFGVLPAVLGLMIGGAVGPYRHIHLMQFADGKYVELMELLPRR